MSSLFQTLIPYVPLPVIRRILADPHCPAAPTSERFPTATLFADVSGFTTLTEALGQKGEEGPEELTRLLNRYFGRMIALIEAEGGEVVEFGGDAVIVIFPATDETLAQATRRALQAAEAIQEAMAHFATVETSIGPVALGVKIGIGAGHALAMHIGGVFDRWEYVVAGDAMRQVAEAEGQAGRGEIVLSPEAQAVIHPEPLPPQALKQPDWSVLQGLTAAEKTLRCYVPGSVQRWLEGGLHEWLAVLRRMSVLFVSLQGLHYEQAEVVQRLHDFLQAAQRTIYRYEGTMARLAVDDKGTILMVLFGAPPFAHPDDPLRAVRCALDLEEIAAASGQQGAPLQLSTGVTTGHVFAGPVGGETRREYTVMGDTVNLAARLMGVARTGGGDILCDFDTYRQVRGQVALESLPPVRVKGKTGLIRVYRPAEGAVEVGRQAPGRPEALLVGRREELARLEAALEAVERGKNRVLIIEGEAGIGKSRLVAELAGLMQARGLTGLQGAGQSIEQQTPYRAWRDVFESYLNLEDTAGLEERQSRVVELVREMAPDQVERLPLLNDVLALELPENELTASLEPALRQQNLMLLLLRLLRAWAQERPLILVLEDAQWLDSLSWDLATYAARALAVSGNPLLLVLVTRPLEEQSLAGRQLAALHDLVETETLSLTGMSPEETVALATARLGLPEGGLPQVVAELVRRRAEGNPFFAEELVFTLRDQGLIVIQAAKGDAQKYCRLSDEFDRASQTLPGTVQGLVLARIDRLPPERQLTLKVGSVIGRTFAYPTLHYTMDQHTAIADAALKAHLDALSALDLTPLDTPEPNLVYIFKHIITRDVAYGTMLFAQRRALHRTVAEWYEGQDKASGGKRDREKQGDEETLVDRQITPSPGPLVSMSPHLPLLVHHYHHAEDVEKERHYARLAGEQAAGQYANTEAVAYLSRALELTPEDDAAGRYILVQARERVYDLQGDRETQWQDLATLEALAEALEDVQRQAEAILRRANYTQLTGDYTGTAAAAQAVIDLAREGRLTEHESARLQAEGYLYWGQAFWRQGEFDAAHSRLEQALSLAPSAQAVAEGPSTRLLDLEARCLAATGSTMFESGRYTEGLPYLEQALDLYQKLGQRKGEASTLNALANLVYDQGEHVDAQLYKMQALRIYQEMGDRYGEAVILNNLGLSAVTQGHYAKARSYYEQALQICREIGDRQGEDYVLGSLGMASSFLGDYDQSRHYLEQSVRICREVGDRRAESMGLDLLSFASHQMGDDETARAYGQQALEATKEPGYAMIRAYVLVNLGNTLAALGQLPEAASAYQQSFTLRQELGQAHMSIESQAGLARVALAQGQVDQAMAHVEDILGYMAEHSMDGAMDLLRIYWTCYRVLQAGGDPHAREVLHTAHSLLQERAARIGDVVMRQTFLENVPSHRNIQQAFAGEPSPS